MQSVRIDVQNCDSAVMREHTARLYGVIFALLLQTPKWFTSRRHQITASLKAIFFQQYDNKAPAEDREDGAAHRSGDKQHY